MNAALARIDARARTARRVAILAALPPLACHLASPILGIELAPAVAFAEVALALALRLVGVPLGAILPARYLIATRAPKRHREREAVGCHSTRSELVPSSA